ncbi:MAG: cyanophycin synthetase [Candidatus Peribacteraceae bacterium]
MKVYCSGIGGIGLSAYAAHMKMRGHTVMGSDKQATEITDDLSTIGIDVFYTQDGTTLPNGVDLFVYSEAIPVDAPERRIAAERGVRSISYFQAVGELSKDGKVVCIAGSHGKSSTTAMIAKVAIDANLNPNVVLGTKMPDMNNRNWRVSDSDLWIVEACEYRRSFLHLHPASIVLTTLDIDHFDAYANQEDYDSAFIEFLHRLPTGEAVIGHGTDPAVLQLVHQAGKELVDADRLDQPTLSIPGNHMRENARLALAWAKKYGIDDAAALASLGSFSGTWRRMQIVGTVANDVTVIDDYAHHPLEIASTLQAIKEQFPGRRLVCVFQPHMHNRTLILWDQFARAFHDANVVMISDIYDARPDADAEKADAASLAESIRTESKTSARATGSLSETEKAVRAELRKGDVVVVMGAGSITKIAKALT